MLLNIKNSLFRIELGILAGLFSILVFSCGDDESFYAQDLQVNVINQYNGKSVDSALVQLLSKKATGEYHTRTYYTDKKGKCIFNFEFLSTTDYKLLCSKENFVPYLDNGPDFEDMSYINLDGKVQTLYLTSDTMQNQTFWDSRKLVFGVNNVDTLIKLIKTGNYTELPKFSWNEIDTLLSYAIDDSLLVKFPNPIEYGATIEECYVGTLVLWLVESIRVTQGSGRIYPLDLCFPIQPVVELINPEEKFANGIDAMEKMNEAYTLWWANVSSLSPDLAARINPLAGSNIKWSER